MPRPPPGIKLPERAAGAKQEVSSAAPPRWASRLSPPHRTPSLAPHPATTVSGEGSRRSAARLGAALPSRRPPARAREPALWPQCRLPGWPRSRGGRCSRRARLRLAPASPQADSARRVAAGLGTATSKPLPAAPRRRAPGNGRAFPAARAQTPAGRGGAEAAPAARRGARALALRVLLFLLFSPLPVLFVRSFPSSRSKIFNAVAKLEPQFLPVGRRGLYWGYIHSFNRWQAYFVHFNTAIHNNIY